MTEAQNGLDRFDIIYGQLDGLGRRAKPSTVREALPIVGNVTTYTIETMRHDEKAVLFLEATDSTGATRLVIPHKVVQTIVRQFERMYDRSTPESRRRKARSRELATKRQRDHDRGRHDSHPLKRDCPDCRK